MSKKCLIYETLNDVKTMKVKKTDEGLMKLSGVFGVCGVKNNNQRIYESGNYSKMVSEMQGRIKSEGGIPGELEHPQTMNITLENISHKINSIDIDENGIVTGEITLLNTPKGKIAQAIVEGGLPLFISSRAKGTVAKDGKVTLEELRTYDLVGSPGFSQAKLHLNENQVAESICESAYYIAEKDDSENNTTELNENNEDMENKELLEKFEELSNRVEELETANEELQEQLNEKQDTIDFNRLGDSIQNWIVEQFAPEVEKWIVEQYSPEVEKWMVEQYSPEIEKWLNESFKPELTESIANGTQNWIVEEYSPMIQKWVFEHVAPTFEKWITEEYSAGLEGWLTEHFTPAMKKEMNESITESKKTSLDSIDSTLKMLEESMRTEKPSYKRVSNINEDRENEPIYIAEMPEDKRPLYNMASKEVKESIARRAKLYNFVVEGAIEKFWNNVSFEENPNSKPKQVYEGLNESRDWESNIRMQLRHSRFH